LNGGTDYGWGDGVGKQVGAALLTEYVYYFLPGAGIASSTTS